jgi:hypothetical protein
MYKSLPDAQYPERCSRKREQHVHAQEQQAGGAGEGPTVGSP